MAEGAPLSRAKLELLYGASLEFNSTLDVEELLPRVFDRVIEALQAEAGSIWLRRGDVLVCHIARGPVGERIEGLELPVGAGIVGDVALSGRAELVADAGADSRFVHQVDEATGFETRSVVSAPLRAKDQVLGVLQVLNKRTETGRFDEEDLALLDGLGSTAGLALRNAQLHDAERRARDLRSLLRISREVSSTLDVDRLVMSVVNLGSQILAYDRAAIALYEGGRPVLRAISGQETVDPKDADTKELGGLIGWLLERGEVVYLPDVTGEAEVSGAVRSTFSGYLERTGTRSLCLIPLKDEEGRLGGLYLESASPEFLGEGGREAAEILANQVAVTVRNAELYGQVPLIGLLEPVAAWRRKIASAPRREILRKYGVPALIVLAVLLFPWRERIAPREAEIVAGSRMPLRATVSGLLEDIRVAEGEHVESGQVLAVLRDDELRLSVAETEAELAAAERAAAAARARGAETEARLSEIRARELTETLGLLREREARTRLVAPVAGAVLTLRPHERLGEWLDAGDTFVVLGRTDRVELEARVAQKDIRRVAVDQRVRLKVAALPAHTFVGTVTEIATHADALSEEADPTLVVRAGLDNSRDLLRPGMEARAKIIGARRPVGYLILRPFVQWIQMRFWR